MMPKVPKLGGCSDPRLMPNPKPQPSPPTGRRVSASSRRASSNSAPDRTGIVHVRSAKASFTARRCWRTSRALQKHRTRPEPSGSRAAYWRILTISAIDGPGIDVDFSALQDIKQES